MARWISIISRALSNPFSDTLFVPGFYVAAETDNPSYHPGRCASIMLSDKKVGVLWSDKPDGLVCSKFGLSGAELYVCELAISDVMAAACATKKYIPFPKFPAITRDFAVITDENIPVYDLQKCIEESIPDNIEKVEFFDVYRGAQIPAGKKSVALLDFDEGAGADFKPTRKPTTRYSRALETLISSF